MEGSPRLKVGSSAKQVECHDELIAEILLRVSTRDVLKMSTVHKRWRTLIFDPSFAHTHYKNSHLESIFYVIHRPTRQWLTESSVAPILEWLSLFFTIVKYKIVSNIIV
ncbi:hypothetical protein SUGI_0047700 [Cryptomeria japonica]|nr:hypothetical protein SUGI_0047700 [Cryptomeria japonica]